MRRDIQQQEIPNKIHYEWGVKAQKGVLFLVVLHFPQEIVYEIYMKGSSEKEVVERVKDMYPQATSYTLIPMN